MTKQNKNTNTRTLSAMHMNFQYFRHTTDGEYFMLHRTHPMEHFRGHSSEFKISSNICYFAAFGDCEKLLQTLHFRFNAARNWVIKSNHRGLCTKDDKAGKRTCSTAADLCSTPSGCSKHSISSGQETTYDTVTRRRRVGAPLAIHPVTRVDIFLRKTHKPPPASNTIRHGNDSFEHNSKQMLFRRLYYRGPNATALVYRSYHARQSFSI